MVVAGLVLIRYVLGRVYQRTLARWVKAPSVGGGGRQESVRLVP